MRTSKISQDTSRIFNALSPNTRSTRSSRFAGRSIATFALGYDGSVEVKQEEHQSILNSTPSIVSDIEDTGSPPAPRASKKRKRENKITTAAVHTEHHSTGAAPRRKQIKQEDQYEDQVSDVSSDVDSKFFTSSPRKSKPKLPAKRVTAPNGTVSYVPPSNWDTIYSIVHAYRSANPNAPVDTMGCEDLYFAASPPREQRYHTLTALMLSSQTKDTVTAAAMQRLHTELISDPPTDPITGQVLTSSLTIENILTVSPIHLDHLIGKVGFHNTKTKHIKQVAQILHDQYACDIPNTIEGLVSLPGVGPKMAYLCMSAAWKEDLGIGVDVHVHRITNLWGWHNTKTPEQTRESLQGWLPQDKWHAINKLLVGLGQTVCLPIGRRCGECPLAGKGLCKSEVKGWIKKEDRKQKKVRVKSEIDKVKVEVEEKEEEEKVAVHAVDEKISDEKRIQLKEEELVSP